MTRSFELAGLDGTNPLGFLAALGTLVSLHQSGLGEPRLRWERANRLAAPIWMAVLEGVDAEDEKALADVIAVSLRGKAVPEDAKAQLAAAQREMELAKKAVEKKRDEIKKRGLRGSERTKAEELELRPLQREYEEKRGRWLRALQKAVPRPELALGKRIEDCTGDAYREHAGTILAAGRQDREALDMLASFGSDACCRKDGGMEPTPFSFISGSGHQYFLDTARQLVAAVSMEGVWRTLFKPWDYRDRRLSMRWDPREDRRYALMDRDPTAPGNEPRTMWMANLLAYRALAIFSTAPVGRRLQAAGWDPQARSFSWPLWECSLSLDAVRSLVRLRELVEERPDVSTLRACGIVAVYRANRVFVGSGTNRKVNFSAARQVG